MQWESTISENSSFQNAMSECVHNLIAMFSKDRSPTVVFAFISMAYSEHFNEVPEILGKHFPDSVIFGCSASGVIGDGKELERTPAIALSAAVFPGVSATPFVVTDDVLPTPDEPPEQWMKLVGLNPVDQPCFIVLMDPFCRIGEQFLSGLDFAFPLSRKAGGLASGGLGPGSHALFSGKDVYRKGLIGIGLTGNIVMDTIVTQGCKPIGDPGRITESRGNVLFMIEELSPMEYLRKTYALLPIEDQHLIRGNLFLGIAVDPFEGSDNQDDFLIRKLIGIDKESGAIAVGGILREGQLVQFHVRDATTSSEDLNHHLRAYLKQVDQGSLVGALMFQCNGRGIGLYGSPDHDLGSWHSEVGPVPIGGFFCNGELGQIGSATFIHEFTSSFAIFRQNHG